MADLGFIPLIFWHPNTALLNSFRSMVQLQDPFSKGCHTEIEYCCCCL